jgi:pseudouridine synthase
MPMRLQKALALAGIASRRAAEALISEGAVSVNGQTVTQMGTLVDPAHDRLAVNGTPVVFAAPPLTLMLNKPVGYICSADAAQGQTVFALVRDIPQRLFTIGRLDKNSEGLLLLTNDGQLANRLTHPRYEHSKIYEVTVGRTVSPSMLAKLSSALVIDGTPIQPARVIIKAQDGGNRQTLLEFTLKEGRNRQIRKMCEQVGLRILQLRRIQVGQLQLGALPAGKYRELTPDECGRLEISQLSQNCWNG